MHRKEVPCSIPHCPNAASYKIAASWTDGSREELTTYELACVQHFAQAFRVAERRKREYAPGATETVGELGIYRFFPGEDEAPPLRLRGLEAACRSWDQAQRKNAPQLAVNLSRSS
jgi:hypothetical protein